MNIILPADSLKYPLTGIGRYTLELSKQLQTISGVNLNFLYPDGLHRGLKFIDEKQAPNALSKRIDKYRRLPDRIHRLARRVPGTGLLYRAVLSKRQRALLANFPDHVFHGTNFYLPPFPGSKVVTIHDLSVFFWPECHPRERVRVVSKYIRKAVSCADIIVTDSEYTRKELAEYFAIPLQRIKAIPLGLTEFGEFDHENDLLPFLLANSLEFRGYSLFIGTIEPRKNLLPLLHAYKKLPVSLREAFPLVIAGYSGWHSSEEHRLIRQFTEEGWLQYRGYISSGELPLLYAGARLFVFPSRYEGFGLPVLEAMQFGVPVICSRSASLPEVAGDAAEYFDHSDEEALHHLLSEVLDDQEHLDRMARAGVERAKCFSWKKTAEATLAVYQSL